MNKIKEVFVFVAFLVLVLSGFAVMTSADTISKTKFSSATIYAPGNYSTTEQTLNVVNTESISIISAPTWLPRNFGFSYYSPGLEIGYSGLKTKKYTLKIWLLERTYWYCASTQICEKTIQIDNTAGNNSSGIIRITGVFDVYDYPTFDWLVRLYDGTKEVSWDELYATGTYNRPPQLFVIGDKEVFRNHLLEFTINGTDPNGDGLTYQADNLPSGASFDPENRTFSWIPTTTGQYSNIRFRVTDDGEGNLYDSEYITIIVRSVPEFDTGKGTYPSIFGTHNGTINLNQTITVSKLYTYPCPGTGGHSEYVKIWNKTWDGVEAHWRGYKEEWHNLTFSQSFTLYSGAEYNYTIRTGSYPQIHHTDNLSTPVGFITCSEFIDANGKTYHDWIPAIRLE